MDPNDTVDLTTENIHDMLKKNNFVVIGFYGFIFLVALFANILVIIVVSKDKRMRSVTNYFLVNLASADLLVTLICMPNATLHAYTVVYYYGAFFCKVSFYMQCVSVASSILTITTMATDRYVAIIQPFGFNFRLVKKSVTVFVIIAIWLISMILFLPILWISKLEDQVFETTTGNVTICICQEVWTNIAFSKKGLGIMWFLFIFAIPGLIMIFTYSVMGRTLCSVVPALKNGQFTFISQGRRIIKERKRVACILLLLALIFAICWLPYHVISLMNDLDSVDVNHVSKEVTMYTLLLGHSNSALNPIVYCILSKKFRISIREIFWFNSKSQRQASTPSGSAIHLHKIKSPSLPEQLNRRISSSPRTTRTCIL